MLEAGGGATSRTGRQLLPSMIRVTASSRGTFLGSRRPLGNSAPQIACCLNVLGCLTARVSSMLAEVAEHEQRVEAGIVVCRESLSLSHLVSPFTRLVRDGWCVLVVVWGLVLFFIVSDLSF